MVSSAPELGDKKSLFCAESVEETTLCVKDRTATTSGREAGLRLRDLSGKWLEGSKLVLGLAKLSHELTNFHFAGCDPLIL